MNNSAQAQNGFKTFILTLSISLLVFSIIYYFVSDSTNASAPSLEEETSTQNQNKEDKNKDTKVASITTGTGGTGGSLKNEDTAFGKISKLKTDASQRKVLGGGASEVTVTPTPESTVPNSGTTEITYGFFISLLLLSFGLYIITQGPRFSALKSFERDLVNNA